MVKYNIIEQEEYDYRLRRNVTKKTLLSCEVSEDEDRFVYNP